MHNEQTTVTAKTQQIIERKQALNNLLIQNKITQEEYDQKSKLLSNIII